MIQGRNKFLTFSYDDGVTQDKRLQLEKLGGHPVVGLAYPGGGPTHDERVVKLIREHTGIRYARTTISNYSFDVQEDLLQFQPTVYHREYDKMMELGEKFINQEALLGNVGF